MGFLRVQGWLCWVLQMTRPLLVILVIRSWPLISQCHNLITSYFLLVPESLFEDAHFFGLLYASNTCHVSTRYKPKWYYGVKRRANTDILLRLPHRYATLYIKSDPPPLHVSLNNSVTGTRPSFKNLRDNFLTKWPGVPKVCLPFIHYLSITMVHGGPLMYVELWQAKVGR